MMDFGDNRLKKITRFLYKWMWCAVAHRKHRCWPRYPNSWHCRKCHACSEVFDIVLGNNKMGWT